MKKVIVLLFVLVLSSFNTYPPEFQSKDFLTSGKWFIESVQESGQEPEMTANKNDEWVIFHKDGKLEESFFGKISNATWDYSEENKSIKITDVDVIYKKIIEISESKLIVELIEDASSEDTLMVTYVK